MTALTLLALRKALKRIGVVAFVGEELADAGDAADASLCDHAIGGVARREDQEQRTAQVVDNRMNLAV